MQDPNTYANAAVIARKRRRFLPETREGWLGLSFALAALTLVLVAVFRTLEPTLSNWSNWGTHDWDQVTAYRYVMVKSFKEFGQFPLWNPYTCGGHSAWANVQEVSNLVSPFMPLYLFLDLRHAIRLELLGTVLLAVAGCWLLASRYTKSAGLRGVVCVIFALNGRWAMQVATGHDWHWYYAVTPWVFLFFERALAAEDRKRRFTNVVLGAVFVASMVYTCAIYPLPHTLTLLGCYALALAVMERSLRPLFLLSAITITGLGLAAPKLVPTLDLMARFPRLVDSLEYVELRTLVVALTAPGQAPGQSPAPAPQWGWHEYGIYIGVIPFLMMLLLVPYASSMPARAMRVAALVALLFGLGSFHPQAPWSLVHELPLFSSQHVPSRWLHPAVLLFAVVAVSAFERTLGARKRRYLLEAGLLVLLGFVAFDVSRESHRSLRSAFTWTMRPLPPPGEYFQVKQVPPELQYDKRDYAPESLPAMLTNRGVIDCTMMPAQNVWAPRNAAGRVIGIGARGKDEADYRGEVFLKSGRGEARFTAWSPNWVEVSFTNATAGDVLILNQNWDPGWTANGVKALNEADRAGYAVTASSGTVRFSFWPRGFGWGIAAFALTLAVLLVVRLERGPWARLASALRARLARGRRRDMTSPEGAAP
jgi:hypothetical protein